jgi:hypothetical protein
MTWPTYPNKLIHQQNVVVYFELSLNIKHLTLVCVNNVCLHIFDFSVDIVSLHFNEMEDFKNWRMPL